MCVCVCVCVCKYIYHWLRKELYLKYGSFLKTRFDLRYEIFKKINFCKNANVDNITRDINLISDYNTNFSLIILCNRYMC